MSSHIVKDVSQQHQDSASTNIFRGLWSATGLIYMGDSACEGTLIGVVTADGPAGIAALHDLDPEFRSFSRSEKVAAILESLHIKQPLPVQSMYIFKAGSHTALVCIPGPMIARSGWACHTASHARSHMSQTLQLCGSSNAWSLLLCGVRL